MPIVAANGINIYYEIHGTGDPLVLIAGLGTDLTQYARIIRDLATHVQVIAFDNRGAGRTDKPDAPYSIEMMADDTAGLMCALGLRSASVLGVSMGGRIALTLALRHPERVTSLVLVSTSAAPVPSNWLRRLLFLVPRIPFLGTLGDQYPQPAYAFARQRVASRGYDVSDRLSEIRVPTLILHGQNDRITPYACAEQLRASIPGSQLLGFDGGHLVVFFQSDRLLSAVADFLEAQVDKSSANNDQG